MKPSTKPSSPGTFLPSADPECISVERAVQRAKAQATHSLFSPKIFSQFPTVQTELGVTFPKIFCSLHFQSRTPGHGGRQLCPSLPVHFKTSWFEKDKTLLQSKPHVAEPLQCDRMLSKCLSQLHVGHIETHLSVVGTDLLVPDEAVQAPHTHVMTLLIWLQQGIIWGKREQGQDGHFPAFLYSPIARSSAHLEDPCKEPHFSSALSHHCPSHNPGTQESPRKSLLLRWRK